MERIKDEWWDAVREALEYCTTKRERDLVTSKKWYRFWWDEGRYTSSTPWKRILIEKLYIEMPDRFHLTKCATSLYPTWGVRSVELVRSIEKILNHPDIQYRGRYATNTWGYRYARPIRKALKEFLDNPDDDTFYRLSSVCFDFQSLPRLSQEHENRMRAWREKRSKELREKGWVPYSEAKLWEHGIRHISPGSSLWKWVKSSRTGKDGGLETWVHLEKIKREMVLESLEGLHE